MAGPDQAYDNGRPFSSKPKRPVINMFEIIGSTVVAFIAWLIIKGYLRAKSTIRSQEFGKEARYIATHEFNAPDRFFTYFVQARLEDVKTQALQLKDRAGFERFSWPRLMAWAIYVNAPAVKRFAF